MPPVTTTGLYSGALFDGQECNYREYMWNGRNRMRVFDGVTYRLGGIVTPSGSITAAIGGAGANLSGTYFYYAVPVNSKHLIFGLENKSVKMGLPMGISGSVSPSGQKVQISGIPTHTDPQVDYWYIFRNKSGEYTTAIAPETQPFYYVGRVANGTATFDDPVASDDSLNDATLIDFRANYPLPFKHGFVYNDVLYGYGFDPITDGTATVNGTTTLIDFSGVLIPDGVVGCYFQKIGDATRYIITEVISSTQIQLDSAFVGTLSAGNYTIFLDESRLWNSNYRDYDAWGLATELRRNQTPVGGRGPLEKVTGHAVVNGAAYVFTLTKIYKLTSSGQSNFQPEKIKLIFDGIGSVGGRAVTVVEDVIYFCSAQGPYRYRPEQSQPEYIGQRLGTSWLDSLVNTEAMSGIVVQFSPKTNCVKSWCPDPDNTINNQAFVHDRNNETWWKEVDKHPLIGFNDYAADGRPSAFYAQGAFIVQDDEGTNDGLPTGCTPTGTLTGATTLSATDTTAAFTASSGLKERYVHFWRNGAFIGKRKITSNSGTVLNWTTALTPAPAVGDTYYIAPVSWAWKSKDYYIPGMSVQSRDAHPLYYNLPATAGLLISTNWSDGTARANPHKNRVEAKEQKPIPLDISGFTYALKIQSPVTNAAWGIRNLGLQIAPLGDDK